MCSSFRQPGFRQLLTVIATLATCIALACDSPSGPDPATIPVELRLSADSVRVFEGSSVELTASFLNGDGATIDPAPEEWPIAWFSSNDSVAVVVDGLVTGLSPGESVITVSSGELSDQATVNVRAVPMELRLSADSVRVFEGSSVELTATFLNGDGAIIDPAPEEWPIAWFSSNESVAGVVDGLVTGLTPGKSVITASSGELSDQATVDVRAVPTAEDLVVAMDVAPDTVGSGGSFVIHYTITNTARDTAILQTPGTYLVDLHATRDGQEFAFGGGPGGGLWTGDWRIAPGTTMASQIHVTAAIVPGWVPADPGVYVITLESNVVEINGRGASLPSLEQELVLVLAPTLEDLTFAMSLEPDTVAPGESFMLSYSITNMASVQVILRFPSTCIYRAPTVYRGDERVYFAGTLHGCRAAFWDWEIAPGATLTHYHGASATILMPPPDLSEQGPAEPGGYLIVWPPESPMWINRYPAEIPTLSDTLTVAG